MRTTLDTRTDRGTARIVHDAALADVEVHEISPGLGSMIHSPVARRSVLRNLAADPRARLTLAVHEGAIVGHTAVGPSFGRWRDLPRAREIAFEVAREWRGAGLLTRLTAAALADPSVEDEILLAFLWPSAWDTQGTGLDPSAYRAMLERLGARNGFLPVPTDEPEIMAGGSLIVRVGARVPHEALVALDAARFRRRPTMPAAA